MNRLMNMGIEPFLVASSVHLICAQRLVRHGLLELQRAASAAAAGAHPGRIFSRGCQRGHAAKGAGCDRCNLTGYKGRVGLYEVMEITEELRELILVGASGLELRRKAVDDGMLTLRHERAPQSEGRYDDDRRGGEGDGEVRAEAEN